MRHQERNHLGISLGIAAVLAPSMSRTRLLAVSLALLAGGLLADAPAGACQIPVFRYALERWPSDPFELVVFHRGPLDEADQAAVESLRKRFGPGGPANLAVVPVDLDSKAVEPDLKALWEAQQGATLPYAVLAAPFRPGVEAEAVWSGPLAELPAEALTKSPARDELLYRLLRGDSVVWVVLRDGDDPADSAVIKWLTTHPRPDREAGPDPARGSASPARSCTPGISRSMSISRSWNSTGPTRPNGPSSRCSWRRRRRRREGGRRPRRGAGLRPGPGAGVVRRDRPDRRPGRGRLAVPLRRLLLPGQGPEPRPRPADERPLGRPSSSAPTRPTAPPRAPAEPAEPIYVPIPPGNRKPRP